MAIQQPLATDPLNVPDHALSHRVFANDDASPVQSVVVDATGQVSITQSVTASNLSGTNTGDLSAIPYAIALG